MPCVRGDLTRDRPQRDAFGKPIADFEMRHECYSTRKVLHVEELDVKDLLYSIAILDASL